MGHGPSCPRDQAPLGEFPALNLVLPRNYGTDLPKLRINFGRFLLACLAFGLPILASAHPANIPVGRAKVHVDGKIELSITFDILAFVLDQTPQIVLDAPMNALLDGPISDLQSRLDAAKKRFMEGLAITDGLVDSIDFPTASDIHKVVDGGQLPRLPVMMTATFHGHLKPGVRKVSFHFPEVMGTVVLSTEFSYFEPISESVEPGEVSTALEIPTQAQVDAAAATMRPTKSHAVPSTNQVSEARARKAIQKQYDRWSKAYMAHDITTLASILSPDYTLKTAQGTTIKRAEYDVMLKLRKQKHSDTTLYKTEIVRMTLKDQVAAIWSRETTTDPGLNQKTGKAVPVSYQHDYIDVWVLSKGQWLLRSTVTQKEQLISLPKGK